MKFEYERAELVFVNKVGGSIVNVDQHGFSRNFTFNAEGIDYNITWFHNQSTLYIGNLQVMFHSAEVSNTWPSPAGAKSKLQFYDANKNTVAVIVLERY